MNIEAIKLALEALEFFKDTAICSADTDVANEAITSLRQAIAEAEKQEPVAWWNGKESVVFMHEEISTPNWTDYYYIPLYTNLPKREWVGLTDEEIKRSWSQALANTEGETYLPTTEFARVIEAKLKEKNA